MINCGWIHKLRNIHVKCLHCIKKNLDTDCLSIRNIINLEKCKFGWKLVNRQLPRALMRCALTSHKGDSLEKKHSYNTRNKNIPNKPHVKSRLYNESIFCSGIVKFNKLSNKLKKETNYRIFCKKLKYNLLMNK